MRTNTNIDQQSVTYIMKQRDSTQYSSIFLITKIEKSCEDKKTIKINQSKSESLPHERLAVVSESVLKLLDKKNRWRKKPTSHSQNLRRCHIVISQGNNQPWFTEMYTFTPIITSY